MDGNADQKRRRIHETSSSDIDGLSDQLQSVSLAISAAMDRGSGDGPEDDMQDSPVQTGMEELRRWYQTEVFAASDAQQHRWEERRWAFLGQLQHALRKPLTHTVFTYNIDALLADSSGNESNLLRDSSPPANDCDAVNSAFGGLLFVGRSRYNDIVVADETVSRVHCIIVRSNGIQLRATLFLRQTQVQLVFSTVGRAMVRSHSSAVERTEIVKNQLSIIEDPFFSMRANHSLLEYVV